MEQLLKVFMKYFFIFLILAIAPASLMASPKIAVVSAIEPFGPIEQNFQKRFEKSGYELKFIRRATAIKTRNELLDKNNVAVFFIGHANSGSSANSTQAGFRSANTVLDYYGNNIADIFSTTHSQLAYLGLIGCNADAILKNYKNQGLLRSTLTTFSFKEKVYPNDHFLELRNTGAVSKAIDASMPVLSKMTPYEELFPYSDPCSDNLRSSAGAGFTEVAVCRKKMELNQPIRIREEFKHYQAALTEEEASATMIVRRTVPNNKRDYSPAKLSFKDTTLFIFPSTKGETTQEFVVSIPKELMKYEELARLELQSLAASAGSDSLKDQTFEIYSPDYQSYWNPITGKSGKPLGDKTQIYLKNTHPTPL